MTYERLVEHCSNTYTCDDCPFDDTLCEKFMYNIGCYPDTIAQMISEKEIEAMYDGCRKEVI